MQNMNPNVAAIVPPTNPVAVTQQPMLVPNVNQHGSLGNSPVAARLSLAQGRFRSGHSQDYYYRKWKKLKKMVKDTVFLNAAACDEVVRVEEKLAKAKEERRFLLRKLLQYQSSNDINIPMIKSEPRLSKSPTSSLVTESVSDIKVKAKKKVQPAAVDKKKSVTPSSSTSSVASKDMTDTLQPKPKKSKSGNIKRTIPPIPLDTLGRPVFPMVMGDLTVHSIGEIMEKSSFHSLDSIYPVGYVSTRLYANMHNPDNKCLYTCKISDVAGRPVFDIAPDESPDKIIRTHNPDECVAKLIQIINKSKGTELAAMPGNGVDFFGLSHPLVRNLIQSCPGAKKCSGYKWIKFEINKNETVDGIEHCTTDPVVHFEPLKKLLSQLVTLKNPMLEQSSNLRSLLTSGPKSTST